MTTYLGTATLELNRAKGIPTRSAKHYTYFRNEKPFRFYKVKKTITVIKYIHVSNDRWKYNAFL